MGLLDHLLDGFGGTGGGGRLLRNNLRKAESLLRDGERADATITGIRVRRGNDDSPDQHEFALAYSAGTGPVRAGCRQRLGGFERRVRLGMEVPIRHDGEGRAIVELTALGLDEDGTGDFKPLGEPPADGIEDENFDLEKERRKAAAVSATVLGVTPFTLLGIATENVDVRVRVDGGEGGPYETVVKRALVPFYATHLAAPGTVLPALVRVGRPDKVKLDWPAAALADPGVGRPPAEALAASQPAAEEVASAGAGSQDWSPEGLAAVDPDAIDGVDFDLWVRVEAGLVRDGSSPPSTRRTPSSSGCRRARGLARRRAGRAG